MHGGLVVGLRCVFGHSCSQHRGHKARRGCPILLSITVLSSVSLWVPMSVSGCSRHTQCKLPPSSNSCLEIPWQMHSHACPPYLLGASEDSPGDTQDTHQQFPEARSRVMATQGRSSVCGVGCPHFPPVSLSAASTRVGGGGRSPDMEACFFQSSQRNKRLSSFVQTVPVIELPSPAHIQRIESQRSEGTLGTTMKV